MSPSTPRVRFSPAPTGQLHVGSARTALFNWLFARNTGGTLVLRIEDTDTERSRDDVVQSIGESLAWLGIDFDEGPYFQSDRIDQHLGAIDKLLADGKAYVCDCTPEVVAAHVHKQSGYDGHCRDRNVDPSAPSSVVRFRTPDQGETTFDDIVKGEVRFEHENLEDFVLRRSNGTPVFLIANAVDDLDMNITHVIRGDDLVNVTPKVLLLRAALGHTEHPVFAHLPMLVNDQRKKLSKRRDDVSLGSYRDRGYVAPAMANYLALLGWSPKDEVEIRPMSEIVAAFDLADVNGAPAFFDVKKLTAFNAEYLRAMSPSDFAAAAEPWLRGEVEVPDDTAKDGSVIEWTLPYSAHQFDPEVFAEMAPVVQQRARVLSEAPALVGFLFVSEPSIDPDAWDKVMVKAANTARPMLVDTIATYEGIAGSAGADGDIDAGSWNAESLHSSLLAIAEGHDLKLGKAQAPIRVAVTGTTVGPPLFEALEVLGADETLRRLRAGLARLDGESGGSATTTT